MSNTTLNDMTAAQSSIGGLLPWARILLDYTDAVCGCVTEEHWDMRPEGQGEGYWFSLGEFVMHLADSRREILGNISGEIEREKLWCSKYGGTSEAWQWRSGSRAEVLASLAEGRAMVDAWLARPASELGAATDASVSQWKARVEKIKAAGKDASAIEAAGPESVADCLMFLIGHEQSHRGALQALLRLHGLEVTRYA
ncbi:DinB family protein [bacterium]|nr:DinB family protein [bacterium]